MAVDQVGCGSESGLLCHLIAPHRVDLHTAPPFFESLVTPVLFGSIALTGLTVAFLHAALPTHWLPFVLAGRAQGWSRRKTLAVTGLAGAGHVAFTIVLGAAVAWAGIVLDQWIGRVFPYIASAALLLLGFYYLLTGDDHSHWRHSHGQTAPARPPEERSERAVILSLVAVLTFSPCEGFLPVFAAGAPFGWSGFLLLGAVLLGATLAGMLLFTWLTLLGMDRFKLHALEHYEGRVVGGLLIALGFVVLVLET